MSHFHILHRTHYIYSGWVIDSANQIKLYPVNDAFQKVSEHHINITGQPSVFTTKDYFGNTTGFFSLIAPHQELIIDNFMKVEMTTPKIFDFNTGASEILGQVLSDENQLRFHDFLKAEPVKVQEEIQAAVQTIINEELHPLEMIQHLSDYIYSNFKYKKGVTTIETSVDEIWKLRAGVCQDFAHMLLHLLRTIGIPARYISGYICPGNSEWRGEGATHAWVEAWLPDTGWVGIDPTNKCLAGDRHIRLANGRNFTDCTPVKGTYRGIVDHKLEVTVKFGQKEFTEDQLKNPKPTYSSDSSAVNVPRNSYVAYLQMQQQQQ